MGYYLSHYNNPKENMEENVHPDENYAREVMQVARSMDLLNINGLYWNLGYQFNEATGQVPLSSKSVFNFYLPDYQPQSFKKSEDELYGPEFQIHNSKTSIAIINQYYQWAMRWNFINSWEEIDPTYLDYVSCESLAKDPEVLLNKFDILFTHGQMTDDNRKIIREAMEKLRPRNMGAERIEVKTDHLPAGNYVLHVQQGDSYLARPLVQIGK